ncbi:serine protease Do [Granulicella pectinivorans]|uniref:Serine protease Do n=1 Tax=Granulicella pectinivorans TaxID=474950 RepID=A0A1I6MJQ6_9BACT|nr:trypsin-like peptidase domain-containing protein [Granulicella pectinivorans]SFS15940.1 serine protease Do [Granulicella pectinivorans]
MESPNPSKPSIFERTRNHPLATSFTLLATLSVGILAGSVLTRNVSGMEQQKVDSSDARPIVIPNPTTLGNGFSQIVKTVGPAVVNINTEQMPKQSAVKPGRRRGARPGTGDDDSQQGDMQDFFNKFFGGQNPGTDDDGDGSERRALGSGYIVDPRGYIITNNHVVDKADKIFVKLASDPEGGPGEQGRPAKVIGVDKETDIAVIKIETTTPLPTVKLGNSDGAQVGDWVLAIGSPFGLSQTVSAGIVSAKNRSIDEGPNASGVATNQFQRFIQTDAAINPGNSGGPLVDMAGNVVGMNTAIYTQSMGSQGVGFAMPSNTVASVYNMLIGPEHKVIRGSIGIQFQGATASAVTRMYGFKNGGVIISVITPGGGAAKAGLQPQDVIVSVDGRAIKDGDDLVADISSRKVGSTVKIGYLRDGKQNTANVTIGDRAKLASDLAKDDSDDSNSTPQEVDAGVGKLGIKVSAIPSAVATKLGVKGGVLVTDVRPGSFSDEISLSKGAVITEINRHPITDESSYRTVVNALKSNDDVVFVVRYPSSPTRGSSYVGGTLP